MILLLMAMLVMRQSLSEYGRLYNWYAVDDVRGLCPSGWHVPTDGEWMTIEMALGLGGRIQRRWLEAPTRHSNEDHDWVVQ